MTGPTTRPDTGWPASTFWDFSLALYAQPEVERACLTLQDEHGLDVNLVLLAAFAAAGGRRLDAPAAARLRSFGEGFQRAVMQPLRQARRALKLQDTAPALAPILADRRRALAALELDLERLEQLQLDQLRQAVGLDAAAAPAPAAAADDAAAPECLLAANLAALYPERRLPAEALAALAAALARGVAVGDRSR